MGAWCLNLQVFVGDDDASRVRESLLTALREAIVADGLEDVTALDPDAAPADRGVVVGPAGRWIPVYDQALDDLDFGMAERLAGQLSAGLARPVAVAGVFDSDSAMLGLFHAGSKLASWEHDIERPRRRLRPGELEAFAAVLLPGKTAEDFADAVGGDDVFVEEKLARLEGVLGWSTEQVTLSHRYQVEDPLDDSTELRFRLPPRPAGEEPPPSPVPTGWGGESEVCVGDPVSPHLTVANEGGAVRGIALVAFGPALEQGLVRLDRATAMVMDRDGASVRYEVPFELVEAPGQVVLRARFHELDLPAGRPMEERAGRTGWRSAHAAEPYLTASGVALAAGRAPLGMAVGIIGEMLDGTRAAAVPIRVRPAPKPREVPLRRPLRCVPPREAHPGAMHHFEEELERLETPRVLQAHIVLDGAPEAVAEAAAEVFERWHAHVAPLRSGPFRATRVNRAFARRSTTLSGSTLAAARGWKTLRRDLADYAMLLARRGENAEVAPGQEYGDGFAWSGDPPNQLAPAGACAPQLHLWLDTEGLAVEAVEAAAALLEELVRELARAGRVVQAHVARWDFTPSEWQLGSNLYERICGVRGDPGHERAWNERYLRAVTERLWLGPELAARVADLDALHGTAEVEELGEAFAIRLASSAELDALERGLEPLLPGPLEATRALEERYSGRRRDRSASTRSATAGAAADPPSAPLAKDLKALAGASARARAKAVERLANRLQQGERSADAIRAALEARLRDDDPGVRRAALFALAVRAPASLAPLFASHVGDEDAHVRSAALEGLLASDRGGEAARDAVLAALDDRSSELRLRAVVALGDVGLPEERRLELALAAMRDRSKSVRGCAMALLAEAGRGDARVIAALGRALVDRDRMLSHRAAELLPGLGSPAEAASLLLTALRSGKAPRAMDLVTALGRCGPAAAEAVPELVARLGSTEPCLPVSAAVALSRIDPARREALPVLEKAFADRTARADGLCEVAKALARLDPSRRDAIEVLLDTLRTPADRGMAQTEAADAVGELRLGEATPLLEALTGEDLPTPLREAAARALAAIREPEHRP